MSIDEAIALESYHPQFERKLEHGDVDAAFASDAVAVVIEGEARMGGQEHFYLEPQCNYVVPIEDDEFLLVASTQVCGHSRLCCAATALEPRLWLHSTGVLTRLTLRACRRSSRRCTFSGQLHQASIRLSALHAGGAESTCASRHTQCSARRT